MLENRRLPRLAVIAALALSSEARAGSAEDDARKLFEDGLGAERAGQTAEACAKFRQSLGLVREIGPLSKVKDCDVKEAKLVTAEANLRELITRWPEPGPELDALKTELTKIEQRIPHLTLKLRTGAPVGVSARLDGKPVDFPADNRALDPGKHELLVDVPNRPLERLTIELNDGESKTIELPGQPATPPPQPVSEESRTTLGPVGIAGIVVAALGVGGFIGAGVTSQQVLDKRDDFDANGCGPDDSQPGNASCVALASEGDDLLLLNGLLWGVGIGGVP